MDGLMLQLIRFDERVLVYVIMRRHAQLDRAVRALTHLGGAAVAIALSLALLLSPVPAWHDVGRACALTLVFSHLAVQLLKRTIARPRPRLPVGIMSLVEAPDRFSFPSGHAAAALSLGLGLAALVGAPFSPIILLLSVLVGLSRCYLGVHYPGDVLAGWLLALVTFGLVAT